jgi:hypothetical protein
MLDDKTTLEAARITHRQAIIVAVVSAVAAISTAAFGSPVVRDWIETKLNMAKGSAVTSPQLAGADARSQPSRDSGVSAETVERFAILHGQILALKENKSAIERDNAQLRTAYDAAKAELTVIDRKNADAQAQLQFLQKQREGTEATVTATAQHADLLQSELEQARARIRELEATSKKGGTIELRRPEVFIALTTATGDAQECLGRAKLAATASGGTVQERGTTVLVNNGAYLTAVQCFADANMAGFVAVGPELSYASDIGIRLKTAFVNHGR